MDTKAFDELAGRVDGVAQALLRITAELEMTRRIDGTRLARGWREARPDRLAVNPQLQASRRVLLQLADQLDAARQSRAISATVATSSGNWSVLSA